MVIAGWRKNFELLADAGRRPCSNCLHTTRHYLVGERQEVRLYFVPVAKFGRKRHLVCETCNHTAPVSDAEASRIIQGTVATSLLQRPEQQKLPSPMQGEGPGSEGRNRSQDGFLFLLANAVDDEPLKQRLKQMYTDGSALVETVAVAAGQMAQRIVGEEEGFEAVASLLRNFGDARDQTRGPIEYIIAVHANDTDTARELLAGIDGSLVVPIAITLNVTLADLLSTSAGQDVSPVDVLNSYLERTTPSSSASGQVGDLAEVEVGSGGLPIIHACDVPGCSYRSHTAEGLEMHFDYVHGAPPEDEASAQPGDLEEPPLLGSKEFKTCPDCAEEVRAAARKCRFCNYRFLPEAMSSDIGPGLRP